MKPKIYHFKEHQIEINKIAKEALFIIEKLKQHNFSAYLVGGSVRDLILKQVPKDFDISTSAKPIEIKKLFKRTFLIGKRFRLAHVHINKKIIEVATFRASDQSPSLVEKQNIWGTEEEDATRRDFTINGLFYDPKNQTIIDYVNGFEDTQKKILKTIGKPSLRFIQDPVRMIRLLKFKARFDFHIEKKTLKALKKCRNEITKSSQARILEELFRMLQSGSSEKFFYLLQEYKLLEKLLYKISKFLKKDTSIYNLLKQIDIYTLKHGPKILQRSILLSALIFPMLEAKKDTLDSSLLHREIKNLIKNTFFPFFHLSRKIKKEIISILSHQFRFFQKKIKIPKDPLFSLAMKFFKIRTMDQKKFLEIYISWHESLINSHKYKKYWKKEIK